MNEKRLLELIEERNYLEIKKQISKMNEVDVAELLDPMDAQTTLLIFRMLPKDLAVEVFAHFSKEQQIGIIQSVTDEEVENIIEDLFFDDMIDLIEEVPANVVNKILTYARDDERRLVNQFLNYPQNSAGSLMTIEYVNLNRRQTVGEALAHIKEVGLTSETVYTCYVTDSNRKLEGFVSLRKIVTSEKDVLIEDIMEFDIISVNTHDDQETVAGVFSKYGFVALPVVDRENRLIGIITVDDIMAVIEQEATEDFQIMAGTSPTEENYLDTSVWQLVKNRLPWLLILMISGTFTGRIMARYEKVLAANVLLSTFIPMLMDTGGNSGSQSSTLIIRGLAVGDIEVHDGLRVIWKELRISIIIGIILAVVNFFRLLILESVAVPIALTVSITLIATVVAAKLVGGILPIIAEKLNLDPAIMAGPLITTIVDALALFVYFMIAQALLGL